MKQVQGQRTSQVITQTILHKPGYGSGLVGTTIRTTTTVPTAAPKKRSGLSWLLLEFAGVVVYKVAGTLGHALSEILMGRQP